MHTSQTHDSKLKGWNADKWIGKEAAAGMWNEISLTLRFLTRCTLAKRECSSWQSALRKQSLFFSSPLSFPSNDLSLSFFPLSSSFPLPLSLQMGCLAGEREEGCASCERKVEAKRGNSGSSGSRNYWWDVVWRHNRGVLAVQVCLSERWGLKRVIDGIKWDFHPVLLEKLGLLSKTRLSSFLKRFL